MSASSGSTLVAAAVRGAAQASVMPPAAFGAAQHVEVLRVPCSGPGDLSGVRALIERGELVAADIVAVMGKTEGNGCVNDFTREYASVAWCGLLAEALGCPPDEAHRRVALVMSGGTEGVLAPHFTVFTRRPAQAGAPGAGKRLVLGVAQTRDFAPEEIGRAAQIEETARAVRAAMSEAGIAGVDDVHFVQVKCPLLTAARIQEAAARGQVTVTHDTYESMAYSRGASSLGIALALDELDPALHDGLAARVLRDWRAYSARASASAGIELFNNVVLVLGEAEGASSPLRIGHTVMRDAIDAASVRELLRERFALDADAPDAACLVNLLAKAEADPAGLVRGARHTMLNDSDINSTRHARAAVGAVLASVAGTGALYVSGGAEHQGPPGGGPVAAIVRVPS